MRYSSSRVRLSATSSFSPTASPKFILEPASGGAMIDHIGIEVADYAKSKAFFAAALAPLGYTVIVEYSGACGLGRDGKPDFWINGGKATTPDIHVAFTSADRKSVDAFFAAAI